MKQLKSAGAVDWIRAGTPVTIDGKEATHFGLDPNMYRYYRTVDGAIYQFRRNEWWRITPEKSFDEITVN